MLQNQPNELILEIEHWLHGRNFERFMITCKKTRKLLQRSLRNVANNHFVTLPDVSSFTKETPSNLERNENNLEFYLEWGQKGSLLGRMRVAGVETPTLEYPFGRKFGVRMDGDRTAISRISLAMMCSIMSSSLGLVKPLRQPFGSMPLLLNDDHENPSSLHSMKNDYNHLSYYNSITKSEGLDTCVYFEVTIRKMSPTCSIRIGLVDSCDWNLQTPPGSLEGSIAYCSHDGHVAIGSKYDDKFVFGNPFGSNDTIGCGYTKNGHVFFTLNGNFVAEAPRQYEKRVVCNYQKCWYAAISCSYQATLSYNFGQSAFKYHLIGNHLEFAKIPSYAVDRACVPFQGQAQKCQLLVGNGEKITNLPIISSSFNSNFAITFHEIHRQVGQSIVTTIPLLSCQPSSIIKKRGGFAYFEVTIINAPETNNSFLSIGLSERPVPSLHHIGWNKNSIGYHSDDGHLFIGSYQGDQRLSLGFGTGGSIIGVGYYPNGTVFFTHDGIRLEKTTKVDGILYPAIAATSHWSVELNIGKSLFSYIPANG